MNSNFVDPPDEAGEFTADSPKGVVREDARGGSGGSFNGPRASQAPQREIEQHRNIARTDPHVHDAVNTLLDWICGDGFNVAPRNIPETNVEQTDADIAMIRRLLKNSDFWRVLNQWVEYALSDGHAFMELVVEEEQFRPRILPTERMHKRTDEFGFVEEYALEAPGGGGPDSEDATQYEPHEIAELWFTKDPTEDFGRSFIEPIKEQADMLRDMEYDYARFVATKAYPPILWQLGSEDEQWSPDQIDGWLDTVEQIEPDSMLAAPHDVDFDVVGVTSTSSSAGAMKLESTFKHLENRIATGLGVPVLLMNMDGSAGEATAAMPSFKRRIKRLQNIVKTAVEQQILKSLMVESSLEDFDGIIPEFEFGEHSSAEKRLEVDKLIKLYQTGMLTREAFAERAGIDPEVELPSPDELTAEIIPLIEALAGTGDSIQNPDGGSPTDTGTGADSAGGEVKSRESSRDESEQRNRQAVTEDEDA
jgi:hypothetical protein